MAIRLNYDDGCNSMVDDFDLCETIEKHGEILFVGEGDFTFTLAFAAWRQSNSEGKDRVWEGITSTCYEPEKFKPAFVWSKVKDASITNIKHLREYGYKDRVRLVEGLPVLPKAQVEYGVDARAIPQSLIPPAGGVIWFQCPWDGQDTTAQLVVDFLVNTSKQLRKGTFVCIGITRKFPYIKSYKLVDILGDNLSAEDNNTNILESYKFLGADVDLIQDILKFGYHHQSIHGDRDIHEQIIDDHVTLVFKKKSLKKKVK